MQVEYSFTPEELDTVLEALKLGTSRHNAFVNYHGTSKRAVARHRERAKAMGTLAHKLETYRAAV